ncbi:MAG: ureidoglycolate lyase [Castellaniella sp.]
MALPPITLNALSALESRLDKPAPGAWPLRAEPLSAAAFRPFGQVIEMAPEVPYFDINDGTTRRYHDLAALEPGPQGRIIVSLFRGQPRTMPLIIRQMERHPLASQAFIPLSGRPWLAVVAPAGPAPRARALRLFVCRGNQGLNYAPGVWHHALIALHAPGDFAVLDREGPGENCDFITLDEPAIIHAPETGFQPALSQ